MSFWKQLRLIAFVGMIGIGTVGAGACSSAASTPQPTWPVQPAVTGTPVEAIPLAATTISVDPAKVFRGVVIKNEAGCTTDATCYLIVQNEAGEEVYVFYVTGRGRPCVNSSTAAIAMALSVGDQVEVFAEQLFPGEFSTCGSVDYYIHQLP